MPGKGERSLPQQRSSATHVKYARGVLVQAPSLSGLE